MWSRIRIHIIFIGIQNTERLLFLTSGSNIFLHIYILVLHRKSANIGYMHSTLRTTKSGSDPNTRIRIRNTAVNIFHKLQRVVLILDSSLKHVAHVLRNNTNIIFLTAVDVKKNTLNRSKYILKFTRAYRILSYPLIQVQCF